MQAGTGVGVQAQRGVRAGEEGKDDWAWLADTLGRALQGTVRFLSACQLPQQQDGRLQRRKEMETDDREREIESRGK